MVGWHNEIRGLAWLCVLFMFSTSFAAGQTEIVRRRFSINNSSIRISPGESQRLPVSAVENEFSLNAKLLSASTASGAGFVFGPDANGRMVLAASLLTMPGNHVVTISASDETGEERIAEINVSVGPLQAVPSGAVKPPVILLNGWQLGFLNSCPISTVDESFGSLAEALYADGVPAVYYFDNCKESPNDAIENLGSKLGQTIDAIRFDTGVQVPQVDLIGHSMGGLIIRSYLAGLGRDGSLSPRLNPRVRKAIQIATPNFGSFVAMNVLANLLGPQTAEMKPGSSFLWRLATWNAGGDDLRGVDALAIIGNGSYTTDARPAKSSDGVVTTTSASLGFARDSSRTRILPYCHSEFGRPSQFVVDCQGEGIATAVDTVKIIRSFLGNTTAWQSIGTTPPQDTRLSRYGGMFLGSANANNIWDSDLSRVSFGTVAMLAGGESGRHFYLDFVSGTDTFHMASGTRGNLDCGPVTEPVGYFSVWRCKSSPAVWGIGPLLSGVPGRVVQSGGAVTISGIGFGSRCSTCNVIADPGNVSLSVSSWTDQAISVSLPATYNGIARIVVRTATGSDFITFMAAPVPVPPTIAVSPNQLQFSYTVGGQVPPTQIVGVTNAGGSILTWTAIASVNWIRLAATPTSLSVSIDPTGLAVGTYRGIISFAAPGAASQNVPVTLTATASQSPSPVVVSLVNSASGSPGPIAPGEIVTIKGSGLGPVSGVSFTVNPSSNSVATALAGSRVLFGGVAAPITYASAGQINAIVPFEIAGRGLVPVQVEYQGSVSAIQNAVVASAVPAAFTFNSTGTGTAVAANQDGSFNGSGTPAAKGSYVTIYFTGGGQTTPPGVTGSVTGSVLKWVQEPVTVTVGGQNATVLFAGAAPGLVDGVGQLNIRLSPVTPSGSAVPLVIRIGAAASNANATLAVQ